MRDAGLRCRLDIPTLLPARTPPSGLRPRLRVVVKEVLQFFHRSGMPAVESEQLSPREHEILDLLVQELILKDVAEQLGFGLETVRTHVTPISQKLPVRSRIEAVVKYLGQMQ